MKFSLPFLLLVFLSNIAFSQDCTLEDASGCACEDESDECYLLPNIILSNDILQDPALRPEFPGVLRISASTPNIGHGPLRVIPTDIYVCGTDTLDTAPQTCPDGSIPQQLIKQRIYKKTADTMTYEDRNAGFMTYHYGDDHMHLHVDDWNYYTLRIEDPNEPNPLNWPIVGEQTKMGFCLADIDNCEERPGDCRDEDGEILDASNISNYRLGGEQYSCDAENQGISVGYTDIYYYNIDGMLITLPNGTCNGKYKLVMEVDPLNQILEENENDNIQMVDVELTQQVDPDDFSGTVFIAGAGQVIGCNGEGVDLAVPRIGSSYLWSNGETDYTINVTEPGFYNCVIQTPCGEAISNTVLITAEECETECVDIELGVYLEGAYEPEKGEMRTNLNNDRKILPGQRPPGESVPITPAGQPYTIAPWNYEGLEGFEWDEDAYAENVVDWVLVSFRDSITQDTEIAKTAALLLKDGEVEFINTCALPLELGTDSVYIIIEHRNHMGVMSREHVRIEGETLKYDFRIQNSYQGPSGSGSGQVFIEHENEDDEGEGEEGGGGEEEIGIWAMFAGDGNQEADNQSYEVSGFDKIIWFNDNGKFNLYLPSDYNLDGEASSPDKIYWDRNNGVSSRVPK